MALILQENIGKQGAVLGQRHRQSGSQFELICARPAAAKGNAAKHAGA